MQNGCICCTLRGDLLKTVKSLAQEGDFDYLVIEVCMSFALLCSVSFAHTTHTHISYVLIHSSSYHARHSRQIPSKEDPTNCRNRPSL